MYILFNLQRKIGESKIESRLPNWTGCTLIHHVYFSILALVWSKKKIKKI